MAGKKKSEHRSVSPGAKSRAKARRDVILPGWKDGKVDLDIDFENDVPTFPSGFQKMWIAALVQRIAREQKRIEEQVPDEAVEPSPNNWVMTERFHNPMQAFEPQHFIAISKSSTQDRDEATALKRHTRHKPIDFFDPYFDVVKAAAEVRKEREFCEAEAYGAFHLAFKVFWSQYQRFDRIGQEHTFFDPGSRHEKYCKTEDFELAIHRISRTFMVSFDPFRPFLDDTFEVYIYDQGFDAFMFILILNYFALNPTIRGSLELLILYIHGGHEFFNFNEAGDFLGEKTSLEIGTKEEKEIWEKSFSTYLPKNHIDDGLGEFLEGEPEDNMELDSEVSSAEESNEQLGEDFPPYDEDGDLYGVSD
ncbi:MAG: hypothetical protein M1814_002425 [Vezdaea aestivalis]|nr:MAG: hypothetical protein M1814_002425 [Vezdaea aestivalis]